VTDVLKDSQGLIHGEAFGDVRPRPPTGEPTVFVLPDEERGYALERFVLFLTKLRFTRLGPNGLEGYNLPRSRIFDEPPPDSVRLDGPSISILPSLGTFLPLGLGPGNAIEETRDVYGKGTVVIETGMYTETLNVEVWSSVEGQRRSVKSGIQTALRALADSGSLRLKLPAYYDQVASFTLLESQSVDDPDVIRNRRRAMIFIEMQVLSCFLSRYVEFRPSVQTRLATATEELDAMPRRFPSR
jgi:hypothetical protein